MTAQPTPANVLNLFKTNAQTTAAKSARVATLVQDGYRRWFDGVTASVNDASRLAAGLGKARTPADLAALQRDWLSTTQARVTESVQGFLDVSSKIAAEIAILPAPAADAAPVAAPAPKAEAPKPVAVAAPKVEAPKVEAKVEAPKVEAPAPAPVVEAPEAAPTPAPVPAKAAETAPVAATAAADPVEVPVKELVETVKTETAAPAAATEVKAAAKPAPRRGAKPVAAKPASKTSPTVN
jgi:hypothetical protein